MQRKQITRSLSAALLVGAGALAVGQLGPGAPVANAQDVGGGAYAIDNVHSSVIFKVMHAGLAPFMGRFNEVSGTMMIDPDDAASSSIDVTIDVSSVDTNHNGRDDHASSGDYLNVKQFPEATFKSTSMQKTGAKKLRATGDFTLHGVTKEISVDIELTGEGEMRGTQKQGIYAEFTFKRSDHGMEVGGLGDEVTMMIGLEAGRR